MAIERTLSIIKPDGVEKGYVAGSSRASRPRASSPWPCAWCTSPRRRRRASAVHRERPFFKDLVAYTTRGPVVLMVLEGENAIAGNREVMGATDPRKAADGTIRKELGTDIERNTVHGSDAPETARTEIAWFFR